jgi:hypothetical protein
MSFDKLFNRCNVIYKNLKKSKILIILMKLKIKLFFKLIFNYNIL